MKSKAQQNAKLPGESSSGVGGPFQSYSSMPLKRKNSLGSTTSDLTEITQKSTATNNISLKSNETNTGKIPSGFANPAGGEPFSSRIREFSKDDNFFPPNNFLNDHNQPSSLFGQNGFFTKTGGAATAGVTSTNAFRSSREEIFKENIFAKSG